MALDDQLRGLSAQSLRVDQAPGLVPSGVLFKRELGGQRGLADQRYLNQRLPEQGTQPPLPSGIVEAFVLTCQRWSVTQSERATLLGYNDPRWAEPLILGLVPVRTQDVRDRIGYIVAISLGLGALYNEDKAAELRWLRSTHEQLREAPLTFILRGQMRNLITVSEIVRRERGL